MVSLCRSTAILLIGASRVAFAQSTEPASDRASRSLSDDAQWRALLHCAEIHPERSAAPCRSKINSGSFFLDPNGANDAEAELRATVRAFRSGATDLRCRYPARHGWLRSQLPGLAEGGPCPALDEWVSTIAPESATLVFPSTFVNNPASAFGHTLLRIDPAAQPPDSRLASYTANFAARTHGENAFSYALKGLFGGYDGVFSVAPYYQKVTQYSDLENRDIWEYDLNLSPDEVRRLVLHLWELREIPFVYYYFDENCSSYLLSLIDTVRPSLALRREFPLWVLPVDTVRAIIAREGLVKRSIFRPSLATKLRHRIAHTSPTLRERALRVAAVDPSNPEHLDHEALADLSPDEQSDTLDLAYDYLTYNRILSRDEGNAAKRHSWQLLSRRAQLGRKDALPPLPPPRFSPERGHETMRLALGIGREAGRWFTQYRFRPVFHDQLDRAAGYLPGAQIIFLETAIRQIEEAGARLQELTVLDIESLSPRSRFFRPRSWTVGFGAQRRRLRSHALTAEGAKRDTIDETTLLYGKAGAGISALGPGGALYYGLIGAQLLQGDALDQNFSLGAGPRLGVIAQLSDRFALRAEGGALHYEIGDRHNDLRANLALQYALNTNLALRFTIERTQGFGVRSDGGLLELHYFLRPTK